MGGGGLGAVIPLVSDAFGSADVPPNASRWSEFGGRGSSSEGGWGSRDPLRPAIANPHT